MNMENKSVQQGILGSAVELGSLLTFLSLSMYVLGYLKLVTLYAALDCLWVIKLNSAQDFVSQGAIGVSSAFVVSVLFSFGRTPFDGLGRAYSVLSLIGAAMLVAGIILDRYFSVGTLTQALMSEILPYAFLGPGFYSFISAYKNQGLKNDTLVYAIGFVMMFSMGLFIHQDSKYNEIVKGFGSTYVLSKNDGSAKLIMVGSVNNKYLAKVCGASERYSIIEPGFDWVVSPIASALDCR